MSEGSPESSNSEQSEEIQGHPIAGRMPAQGKFVENVQVSANRVSFSREGNPLGEPVTTDPAQERRDLEEKIRILDSLNAQARSGEPQDAEFEDTPGGANVPAVYSEPEPEIVQVQEEVIPQEPKTAEDIFNKTRESIKERAKRNAKKVEELRRSIKEEQEEPTNTDKEPGRGVVKYERTRAGKEQPKTPEVIALGDE